MLLRRIKQIKGIKMAEKYGRKVRELMVKEMEGFFDADNGFVLSSFENIKAAKMDSFRKKINGAGSKYVIVKKRLGKMALDNVGLSELKDVFSDEKSIGVALFGDNPVAIAKLMADFAKKNKSFIMSAGCLEGRVFGAEKMKELADMPSRQQLLAMVVGTLNAPITGFVGVMASMVRSICQVVNAIKEKKENES